MIKFLILASLNFNCFLDAMSNASKTELYERNNKEIFVKHYKPAKKKHLKFFLKTIIKNNIVTEK